jgi:GDP-L-fucose synthase
MDSYSSIFVAGHKGLVGSAIVRELSTAGYRNIIVADRANTDLLVAEQAERFFKHNTPEYVILAAARVGGIAANNVHRADFLYENLMIQNHVIWNAYKFGVKKLLFMGSSCIYPKYASQPISESELLTGPLESTNEPYAIAKIAGVKLCENLNRQYGTNFGSCMPTNLYGPNDNFDLVNSHVLPAMLRKVVLAKWWSAGLWDEVLADTGCTTKTEAITFMTNHGIAPDRIVFWGTGKPRREFLHSEDLARAVVFIMQHVNLAALEGNLINIGFGTDVTIKELAGIIAEIIGFEGALMFDPGMPDGTPRKLLDSSRLTSLGWKPEIALREGIRSICLHKYGIGTPNLQEQHSSDEGIS